MNEFLAYSNYKPYTITRDSIMNFELWAKVEYQGFKGIIIAMLPNNIMRVEFESKKVSEIHYSKLRVVCVPPKVESVDKSETRWTTEDRTYVRENMNVENDVLATILQRTPDGIENIKCLIRKALKEKDRRIKNSI